MFSLETVVTTRYSLKFIVLNDTDHMKWLLKNTIRNSAHREVRTAFVRPVGLSPGIRSTVNELKEWEVCACNATCMMKSS